MYELWWLFLCTFPSQINYLEFPQYILEQTLILIQIKGWEQVRIIIIILYNYKLQQYIIYRYLFW